MGYRLMETGNKVLVALSGGKDSLVLAWNPARKARGFPVLFEVETLHLGSIRTGSRDCGDDHGSGRDPTAVAQRRNCPGVIEALVSLPGVEGAGEDDTHYHRIGVDSDCRHPGRRRPGNQPGDEYPYQGHPQVEHRESLPHLNPKLTE